VKFFITKKVWLGIAGVIAGIIILSIVLSARDIYLASPRSVNCDDGQRQQIDMRNFATTYYGYALQFEASFGSEAKLSGKLDPKLLHELSESMQATNDFLKYLVAGYNSCAISKLQYANYGMKYQAMDSITRQIDTLAQASSSGLTDRKRLADLVQEYIMLSREVRVTRSLL
jgi:hypothetical protein